MAKEQDMKSLHHWIFEDESEQITPEQRKKLQNSAPKAPDHFRNLVQEAVQQQMTEAGLGGKQNLTQRTGHPRHNTRTKRRKWSKTLFVVATVLAVGGVAVAAATGSSWLQQRLIEQGVPEEDTVVLLETELSQQNSELTGDVWPGGTPEEKNWSDPLLTVTEAYYDGATLYFLASPSEEAHDYDLSLKDHASVNGTDGIASLEKVDGEAAYFGRIDVMDPEAAEEILQSDEAEVTMTVLAQASYDGRILYTWKDAEAYEEIYGTGAFTLADGVKCYTVTAKDYYVGYTPHELTVQVPLTEAAKQVIGKYREEGKLGEDHAVMITGDDQTSALSATEEASDEESASNEKISDPIDTPISFAADGSHVTCEFSGSDGVLCIDAEIVQNTSQVYIGTLQAEAISEEALKALYPQGTSDNWTYTAGDEGEEGYWQYRDQNIFITADKETAHYQNDECETAETSDPSEEALTELYQQALTSFGMEGQIAENTTMEYGDVKEYTAKILLNGLPLAWYSQWNCVSTAQFENGQLASLNVPGVLIVTDQEEVTLLPIEELMEHVAEYVKEGEIVSVASSQPVTELSLEYYVDLTKQGIVFRPIWNFKVPYIIEESEASIGADNYLYFDAVTGALIRDAYGW